MENSDSRSSSSTEDSFEKNFGYLLLQYRCVIRFWLSVPWSDDDLTWLGCRGYHRKPGIVFPDSILWSGFTEKCSFNIKSLFFTFVWKTRSFSLIRRRLEWVCLLLLLHHRRLLLLWERRLRVISLSVSVVADTLRSWFRRIVSWHELACVSAISIAQACHIAAGTLKIFNVLLTRLIHSESIQYIPLRSVQINLKIPVAINSKYPIAVNSKDQSTASQKETSAEEWKQTAIKFLSHFWNSQLTHAGIEKKWNTTAARRLFKPYPS